jgi:hypothetical protein
MTTSTTDDEDGMGGILGAIGKAVAVFGGAVHQSSSSVLTPNVRMNGKCRLLNGYQSDGSASANTVACGNVSSRRWYKGNY